MKTRHTSRDVGVATMNWIQGLAIWVIASVIATPFIGEYLHKRRVNRE
jgi:hypothetical protein